tara:strand:- start:121 stop:459 length:339 start_codon:yes stop_codon:yes gene_type:complete
MSSTEDKKKSSFNRYTDFIPFGAAILPLFISAYLYIRKTRRSTMLLGNNNNNNIDFIHTPAVAVLAPAAAGGSNITGGFGYYSALAEGDRMEARMMLVALLMLIIFLNNVKF